METMWRFTRRQVIREQLRYANGEITCLEPKRYAKVIQEWLDNVGCYYCHKPWDYLFNDGTAKFFFCKRQECKTMATFRYLDSDVKRWTKKRSVFAKHRVD